MAEAAAQFVRRHRADWDALEALLDRQRAQALTLSDVDQLDRMYRRTTADLSRAQARYPGSEVHRYLNALSARAHQQLYRHRPPRGRAVRTFYLRTFPRTLREAWRYLGVSSGVFLLGGVLGALAVYGDPERAEAYLIPEGVKHAVETGRIWTDNVLSIMPPGVLASQIATHNVTVLITTFALGITFGVGTLWLLLFNGLSLGAVMAYCLRGGLGQPLLQFIAGHGPVEISTILIGGAGGLLLAQALVDPGELPRRDALRTAGRKAITLVVGAAPFLFAIGMVEGFVSPGDRFHAWLKAALGLALGLGFWGYLFGAGRTSEPETPRVRAQLPRR